ncbi:hypothetical protein ACFOW1_06160 [Parasediminibacterium paludis]|uniref:Uncharacterized protein n=1 Tax=Parasediminibacterium paludis TaxID=908966 RepID=A0ABV8PTM5_9BACT
MAEQEIIKHTKKLYALFGKSQGSFWHKLKEFFIEIFIIVFAITLSISFHNWSEHKKEQAQVKTFLLGLKEDIALDIKDVQDIKLFFAHIDTTYKYLNSLRKNTPPNNDSLSKYLPEIKYNIYLRPHKNRFNGFLSAGKIMTIEEDSLALDILNYYQDVIPAVSASEGSWVNNNTTLQNYMLDNVKDIDSDLAKWEVLTTPKGRSLTKSLIPWQQLYDRYDGLTVIGKQIIDKINKLYHLPK